MKKLKVILIGVAVLIAVLLIVIAMQPSSFAVSRSQVIEAPPEIIFPHVNDLRKWGGWNPWLGLDPEMKLSYDGAETGVGASYSWEGNNQVGAGRATILESEAPTHIKLKMEFFKPMEDQGEARFDFAPQGEGTEGTKVTWTMSGEKNFMGKAFGLIMSMDSMIGPPFEKGLASLQSIAEAEASTD